jgi:hypothetical protein
VSTTWEIWEASPIEGQPGHFLNSRHLLASLVCGECGNLYQDNDCPHWHKNIHECDNGPDENSPACMAFTPKERKP